MKSFDRQQKLGELHNATLERMSANDGALNGPLCRGSSWLRRSKPDLYWITDQYETRRRERVDHEVVEVNSRGVTRGFASVTPGQVTKVNRALKVAGAARRRVRNRCVTSALSGRVASLQVTAGDARKALRHAPAIDLDHFVVGTGS